MKITNTLVVLDLETTGTWIDRDKIIEIAMIKVMPDGEIHKYEEKVNPKMNIPQAVTALTGISDADVADAPEFKDLADNILVFIGTADMGGFNVERFDLPLLEREMQEAGKNFNWRERTIYDAQKVFHLNEKRDLKAAYQYYCQKDLLDAHSAMGDTQATLEVLMEQVKKYGEDQESLENLKKFDYATYHRSFDEEGKFRWWNGQLYMMFGKYAKRYTLSEVVQKDPKYLKWILSANFSDEIKVLVEDALNGKFPDPPKPTT